MRHDPMPGRIKEQLHIEYANISGLHDVWLCLCQTSYRHQQGVLLQGLAKKQASDPADTCLFVSGVTAGDSAHRVDEVTSDVAHENAGGQQRVLEGQGVDLERHIVDVYEVDTQGGGHADAAGAEARLDVPATGAGDEGDVALDGLHLQPLKVPLAATPGVGGLGGLQ